MACTYVVVVVCARRLFLRINGSKKDLLVLVPELRPPLVRIGTASEFRFYKFTRKLSILIARRYLLWPRPDGSGGPGLRLRRKLRSREGGEM